MSPRNGIKPNLADDGTGSEGVIVTSESPDADKSNAKDSFSRGVTATQLSGKEIAFQLGMSDQHLSDFRTGQRVVAFHAVWRLCRKHRDTAGASIARDLLNGASPEVVMALATELLAGSDYEVTRRRKVTKKTAKRQMELQLQRSADVFDLIAERAARALGATKEEVIDAWGKEDTSVGDEK